MGSGGSRFQVDESFRVNVTEETLTTIHIEKELYYWIILVISIITVVGNLLEIRTVIIRKYKHLQKTCMFSLAISDLLTVVTFCINYLDQLGKPMSLVWSTGEFLCWYNPVGQVLGNLASSLALLVIALDRYHNVIYALNRKWDPDLWKCIVVTILLWLFCFGVAYPMSTFYFYLPLRLPNGEHVYMCSGNVSTRGDIVFYYIAVTSLFFFPLIVMFFWFYYNIAVLIWRHRKPVMAGTSSRIDESENTSETKCTTSDSMSSSHFKQLIAKKKTAQMERKIRTFRIVIVLILAFVVCRMPYWLFWLVKLLAPLRFSNNTVLRLTLIFTALNLLNCALNPFLYTYLNQTIHVCLKINEFVCTNCCCCFSNDEFEDYETNNNHLRTIYEGALGPKPVENTPPPRQPTPINAYQDNFPQVPIFPKYTAINAL